mmetsp:Transcript_416/g.702  ORF Transcript_416/g.702 Transcript_416/m.702 type:complete len:264 (-) Transcript_416:332-1123(-)
MTDTQHSPNQVTRRHHPFHSELDVIAVGCTHDFNDGDQMTIQSLDNRAKVPLFAPKILSYLVHPRKVTTLFGPRGSPCVPGYQFELHISFRKVSLQIFQEKLFPEDQDRFNFHGFDCVLEKVVAESFNPTTRVDHHPALFESVSLQSSVDRLGEVLNGNHKVLRIMSRGRVPIAVNQGGFFRASTQRDGGKRPRNRDTLSRIKVSKDERHPFAEGVRCQRATKGGLPRIARASNQNPRALPLGVEIFVELTIERSTGFTILLD